MADLNTLKLPTPDDKGFRYRALKMGWPRPKPRTTVGWMRVVWGSDLWLGPVPLIKIEVAVFVVGELIRWWR